MKRHSKILGLAIVAALAFSGLLAASASAGDDFFVGGSLLVGEASTTTASTEAFSLGFTLGGFPVAISCSSLVGTGGTIRNTSPDNAAMGHLTHGNLHFTGCVFTGAFGTKCQVNSEGAAVGTITINNVTGTANSSGTITFSPEGGGSFVTLVISAKPGQTCSVANTYPITGTFMGTEESGELVFNETTGSELFVGENVFFFEGKSTTDVAGEPVTIP